MLFTRLDWEKLSQIYKVYILLFLLFQIVVRRGCLQSRWVGSNMRSMKSRLGSSPFVSCCSLNDYLANGLRGCWGYIQLKPTSGGGRREGFDGPDFALVRSRSKLISDLRFHLGNPSSGQAWDPSFFSSEEMRPTITLSGTRLPWSSRTRE